MAIIGTKANELPNFPGIIPPEQLVIVSDPITGELKRSTFGQMLSSIKLPEMNYRDQIIEAPTIAALPNPGAIKTIYVITSGPNANKQFRWDGTMYIEFPAGSGDVAAEAVIRGNADATLQASIDGEKTNRANADTDLQNNINAEALTRADADTLLNNKIANEIYVRANTDGVLQGLITTEGTTRAAADLALSHRIDAIQTTPGPKGDKGDTGPRGDKGDKGDSGSSTGVTGIYAGTGTPFTTYESGDIIYASAGNTLAKLPKGMPGQTLRIGSHGLPTWDYPMPFLIIFISNQNGDDFEISYTAGPYQIEMSGEWLGNGQFVIHFSEPIDITYGSCSISYNFYSLIGGYISKTELGSEDAPVGSSNSILFEVRDFNNNPIDEIYFEGWITVQVLNY